MDLRSMSVINVSISKIQKITVILCFYVDDIFIVNSDDKMVTSTKKLLNLKFDMKDMRLVDVILILCGIILNQSYYVDKILEKFNKDNSGVAKTPLDNSFHLSKNREKNISQVEYSRVIESLIYLMSCTKINIAYTVSRLNRYTSNPSVDH